MSETCLHILREAVRVDAEGNPVSVHVRCVIDCQREWEFGAAHNAPPAALVEALREIVVPEESAHDLQVGFWDCPACDESTAGDAAQHGYLQGFNALAKEVAAALNSAGTGEAT